MILKRATPLLAFLFILAIAGPVEAQSHQLAGNGSVEYRLPAQKGPVKVTVQASVELHGVSISHPIEITLDSKDGTHFLASFSFSESLTAHKIERPSLLFVPVDDLITIAGKAEVADKAEVANK